MEVPAAKVTLVITWDGPGTPVTVTGPINDRSLCYAMLELAKDACREYVPSPIIQVPPDLKIVPPS